MLQNCDLLLAQVALLIATFRLPLDHWLHSLEFMLKLVFYVIFIWWSEGSKNFFWIQAAPFIGVNTVCLCIAKIDLDSDLSNFTSCYDVSYLIFGWLVQILLLQIFFQSSVYQSRIKFHENQNTGLFMIISTAWKLGF